MSTWVRVGVAGAVVLAGLCAPSTARALRKYVCEHPTNGYCVATKDARSIECQCGDGSVHDVNVPGLDTVSDEGLADACWSEWRENCLGQTQNVRCEAEDRGKCEASNADKGWVDCQCADGRYDGDFNLPELTELEGDALEEACYEQLDDICAPAADDPAPAPTAAVAPARTEPSAGCRVGDTPSAWALLVLGALALRTRRRA